MASKRSCICCGDRYSYCPSCGSDRLKPTWYATFCSETCKDLWEVLSRYSMGFIEEKEAAETIQALSLKDKSKYVECVQRDMEKFLVKKQKSKRGKRAEVLVFDEVIPETMKEEIVSVVKSNVTDKAVPTAGKTHEVVNKTEE